MVRPFHVVLLITLHFRLLGGQNAKVPDVEALIDQCNKGLGTGLKSTFDTREMQLRNCLVRNARDALSCSDGYDSENYCILASQSPFEGHKNRGWPGGQSFLTPLPNFVDIACDGAYPFFCDKNAKFRQITGTCNNLEHRLWGAASTKMRRWLAAQYADGQEEPRGGIESSYNHCNTGSKARGKPPSDDYGLPYTRSDPTMCTSDPNALLPNPRLVSYTVIGDPRAQEEKVFGDFTHSTLFAYYGQFADHDITMFPETETEEDCCEDSREIDCFPIYIPCDDPHFLSPEFRPPRKEAKGDGKKAKRGEEKKGNEEGGGGKTATKEEAKNRDLLAADNGYVRRRRRRSLSAFSSDSNNSNNRMLRKTEKRRGSAPFKGGGILSGIKGENNNNKDNSKGNNNNNNNNKDNNNATDRLMTPPPTAPGMVKEEVENRAAKTTAAAVAKTSNGKAKATEAKDFPQKAVNPAKTAPPPPDVGPKTQTSNQRASRGSVSMTMNKVMRDLYRAKGISANRNAPKSGSGDTTQMNKILKRKHKRKGGETGAVNRLVGKAEDAEEGKEAEGKKEEDENVPPEQRGETSSVYCLDFKRSLKFCQETTSMREQVNGITAFVDGSSIYGNEFEISRKLRTFKDGLLATTHGGRSMIQVDDHTISGDPRTMENPALASFHTLFHREHNRIAAALAKVCCDGNDEQIFQRARRIVVAELENILYGHWLPILLGKEAMRHYHLELTDVPSKYNPTVNPSIRSAFATAAFRMGHTLVWSNVTLYDYFDRDFYTYRVHERYFDEKLIGMQEGRGVDYILNGLSRGIGGLYDNVIVEDLVNRLFLAADSSATGNDLVARNIQRGRDHGIPPYNDFRRHCGMEPACSWDQPPAEIKPEKWARLAEVYDSPSDIDLYVAGLFEEPFSDSMIGRTYTCLVAKQFFFLKYGDRFFFTHAGPDNPFPFDEAQLENVMARTLTDVVCDSTDLRSFPRNPFLLDKGDDTVRCGKHRKLDFSLFSDAHEGTKTKSKEEEKPAVKAAATEPVAEVSNSEKEKKKVQTKTAMPAAEVASGLGTKKAQKQPPPPPSPPVKKAAAAKMPPGAKVSKKMKVLPAKTPPAPAKIVGKRKVAKGKHG